MYIQESKDKIIKSIRSCTTLTQLSNLSRVIDIFFVTCKDSVIKDSILGEYRTKFNQLTN